MKNHKAREKILYVITKSNWGGAQRYVYDLATNSPKDRYEVAVAGGDGGDLFEKLSEKGVRCIHVSGLARDISLIEDITSFFSLWKLFKKELPDIVHLNSSKAGFFGALAARFSGVKKIIFTAHGWPHNDITLSSFVRNIVRIFSFLTSLFAHSTIAVSKAVYRDTPGGKLLLDKIILVRNGIPVSSCYQPEEARRIIAGEKTVNMSDMWIGTIAELHPNKGLEYAIRAVGIYNNSAKKKVALIVIGEGGERESLLAITNELGLSGDVIFPGKRPNAARFLSAFDIFLSSSITEALGYVLLEAGLVGLPVVATSVGGTPEIIDHMKNGILVPSKDPKAMAEAIKFLIDNPEKRKEFGEKLKEKVQKEFKLETMIEKTVGAYSEK